MTITAPFPPARYTANLFKAAPVTESAAIDGHVDTAPRPPSSTPAGSTTPYRPPSTLRAAEYRIRLYELTSDGHMAPLDELDADWDKATWKRNNAGGGSLRCRPTANGSRYLIDRSPEANKLRDESLLVQLWRQNKPILTCRPDAPRFDPATGWYECELVEHGPTELGDPTLGDAERDNLARNGDFSSGFDWWPGVVNVTRSIEVKRGRRAVKLVGTAPTAYMYQIIRVPPAAAAGNIVRVGAWYASDVGDPAPAFGVGLQFWVFEDGAFAYEAPLASVETKGAWTRATTAIAQKPGVVTEVQVNLWAPDGAPIWWRKVQVARPDATSVAAGRDLGQYAAELVRAVSSLNRYRWGRKVTLPIRTLPNGQAARHDRHPSPLDELHDCEPWLDWRFEHATPTSLRFRAYPPVTTPRDDLVLTPDTCDGLVWEQDGPAYSRHISLGEASDYARDEGQAVDLAAFGGRYRDLVEPAPPATDPDDLDAVSARRLRQINGSPVVIQADPSSSLSSPVHVSGEWVHYLRPGEVLRCMIPMDVAEIGRVTLSTTQRISAMDLDTATDRLALTLEGVGADAQP